MKTLREVLQDIKKQHVAVGHFNFSELTVLKAVRQEAGDVGVAVAAGISESERGFLHTRTRRAMLVCDFDQTLGLNHSAIGPSEMLGAPAVLVPVLQHIAGRNSLERCQ